MGLRITFLGGAETVTGSKYLLEDGQRVVLIDCGLFQGPKPLRLRNWVPLPVDPAGIDMVVLTHAHLDHSGYLPLLIKHGFKGRVVCTDATRDLCAILLPDSGYLNEKDAEFANRHGFSTHRPALPLYTQRDAEAAMRSFAAVEFDTKVTLAPGITVRFLPAGHILGAAIVELDADGKRIIFSGDLGRPGSATMLDPASVQRADYLLVESTYGNRKHETRDPEDALAEIVLRTVRRGGTVLIPAFAVGRAQTIMFHLHRLKSSGRIPDVPVFLDSPMAVNATGLLCKYLSYHRLPAAQCRLTCEVAKYVRSVEESKSLDRDPMPKIVISASGMATGGRVVHHLKFLAPDHRNTVLFAGYQPPGTRGEAMTSGADTIRIHGEDVPVRAEVANLDMLSGHADADEIVHWLRGFEASPKMTFITHGERDAADGLRQRIEKELRWRCSVPRHLDRIELQ
ncbi:MAG: MBL fold metallo-hydrolase [Xanthobacteraceae bacterium]|nr:MBL fold metallo-hydrolase [Xanthobacteraceae bacterium]